MLQKSYVPRPCAFAAKQNSGFTLIEMLVVMVIVVILMSLGVMAFRRVSVRMKEDAVSANLDTVIRQARSSAIASGAPAFVEFDTKRSPMRVTPWAYKVVGQWHFEEGVTETKGAYNLRAGVYGCKLVDGKIGKGLDFTNNGHVDCGADPDFDCEDGGYLECYVFWLIGERRTAGLEMIFSKKNAYTLAVGSGGVLNATVGSERLQAESYRLPPRRWTKVACAWDRRSTRILVDDAVVALGPGVKTPVNTEPLLVGSEQGSFHGLMDEVKIMAAVPGKPQDLEGDFTLAHTAAPWDAIFFAADGSLDVRYHSGPVAIDVIKGPKKRSILVSMLGLTQRSEIIREKTEEEEEDAKAVKPTPPPPSRRPLLPDLKKKPAPPPEGSTDEDAPRGPLIPAKEEMPEAQPGVLKPAEAPETKTPAPPVEEKKP